ncbi:MULTISPECIES: anti-phage dCTP deaminase [unclassified Shinella]|uniref:anti-phage dCTP deaminase n=1 Tax=unclassified Shinella TaxID=2643062 RepID=UPI00234F828E|nr:MULTISPECIES: anti-phage dCTP deaminase [unclassified Shinella]MCO5149718.1 deaminase [Shinella sp.]MDC7262374.1 dCMP deaminase [Shinella sp. HY16]MDC7269269.1 dCMP deaminase [Shinella sp. YZ44]
MTSLIPRLEFPEIVIGLVAPIGTALGETIAGTRSYFAANGYTTHEIRVTDVFKQMEKIVPPERPLTERPLAQRYDTYINYGNQLRNFSKDPSVLAALTIQSIVETRLKSSSSENERFTKNVFIVHQFKRPEEIDLLRAVYGKIFFQISVYSMRSSRVDYLSRKFAEDAGEAAHSSFRSSAEQLIDIDENQVREKYGQRVAKIFHDADLIINRDIRKPAANEQLYRFLELLFSSNTITPTKIEYGMFAAKSAALRTSDLSRQVGAAVFSKKGEVISLGSNEVPKAGGGTYWPDEDFDDREFRRKVDSNDKRKREILEDIVKKLGFAWDSLTEAQIDALNESSFMDALEYGRIVHAEMSAISDAARLRGSLSGAVLYSTTFPCHMCAKHIVSSGIDKVFYLEPYPKSLASRLHADSIDIDSQDRGEYKSFPAVDFTHFYGITPRRYRELFQRAKRKDKEGRLQDYNEGKKIPFVDLKSPFYAQLEDTVLESLKSALIRLGEKGSLD